MFVVIISPLVGRSQWHASIRDTSFAILGVLPARQWDSYQRDGWIRRRDNAYRDYKVTDARSHDLIIKALDARAITVTQIPAIAGV